MRLWMQVLLLLAGFAASSPGAAQVRLDPEWVVQFTPAAHPGSPQATAATTPSAEEALLRLVAAEQQHHRTTGRFTGRLSELASYGGNDQVAIHVTAGPDWLVALAVTGGGAPVQATVWRKSAAVESAVPEPRVPHTTSGQQ